MKEIGDQSHVHYADVFECIDRLLLSPQLRELRDRYLHLIPVACGKRARLTMKQLRPQRSLGPGLKIVTYLKKVLDHASRGWTDHTERYSMSDCYSTSCFTVFSKEYAPLVIIADFTGLRALLGKTRVSSKESSIVADVAVHMPSMHYQSW